MRRLAAVSLLSLAGCSTAPVADLLDWWRPVPTDPSGAVRLPVFDPSLPLPAATERPVLGPALPPAAPTVIEAPAAPAPARTLPPAAPPPSWPG